MRIDLSSLMFNTILEEGVGTPSWGTALGQGRGYRITFENHGKFMTGMFYSQVEDTSLFYIPVGRSGNQTDDYQVQMISMFNKVYVNDTLINGASFVLAIVKEINDERSHTGRLSLKYSPKITYKEKLINEECFSLIIQKYGMNEKSAWFIDEINIENQDELHFKMYIIDKEKEVTFKNSEERKEYIINNIIDESYPYDDSQDTENSLNEELSNKEYFKKFYYDNLEECSEDAQDNLEMQREFLQEYPLSRLKELTLDEYALGKSRKDTFSYKLEFGKYNEMIGIGGGTSAKHGVYWRKSDGRLIVAGEIIEQEKQDEVWQEFKNQLYTYLVEYGTSEEPLKRKSSDKYPLLKGMDMVLSKLLLIYYPNKFLSIASKSAFVDIFDYFEYDDNDLNTSEDLNFMLVKNLKQDFEFANQDNLMILGWVLWRFLQEVILNDDNEGEEDDDDDELEPYSRKEFLKEVYITPEKYDSIVSTLELKQNIILQGAPRSRKNIYGQKACILFNGMQRRQQNRVHTIPSKLFL